MKSLEKALSTLTLNIEKLICSNSLNENKNTSTILLQLINLLTQLISLIKQMNFFDVISLAKPIKTVIDEKLKENKSYLMYASVEPTMRLSTKNLAPIFNKINKELQTLLPTNNASIFLVINNSYFITIDFQDGIISNHQISGEFRELIKNINNHYPITAKPLFTLAPEHIENITELTKHEKNPHTALKQILPRAMPEIILNLHKDINNISPSFNVTEFVATVETMSQHRFDVSPEKIIFALLGLLKIKVTDPVTLQLAEAVHKFAETLEEKAEEIADSLPGSTVLLYSGKLATWIKTQAKELTQQLDTHIEEYSKSLLVKSSSSSSSSTCTNASTFFQSKADAGHPDQSAEQLKLTK